MKKVFLLSAIALCLAGSALGQYQTAPAYGNGYKKQNKMAPTPQSYGNNNNNNNQQMQMMQQQQSGYGMHANSQMDQADNYGSSMMNDDASYMKQGSMKQQMNAGGYGQTNSAANSGYGNKANGNAANKYQQEESQHPPMPFAWGYDINDGYGATQYHKENGDEYGKRTGSYGYMDAYGVYRNVYYVADENGFRATIKTNEPGTANESPADVELTAEEPPANVFMGNKDNSGYASSSSSSSSSYDSQNSASSGQYGQSAGASNAGKQYGGAQSGANQQQYGSAANGEAQQQYGGSSAAPMMQQSASRYNNKSNNRNNAGQQQYASASSGMQDERRNGYGSSVAMNGAQSGQYGSGAVAAAAPSMMGPAASSQYGQGNQGSMMAQRGSGRYNNAAAAGGKMRRYGSGAGAAGQLGRGKGQYQGGAMAMMMDAAEEMTTQQYGSEAAAPAAGTGAGAMQQEYGSMTPMNMATAAAATASGYGSSSSSSSPASDDQSTAQQYGPASMLNSPQMQQYNSNQMAAQTAMDGTSTYASTRMMNATAGQSAGYGANRSGVSRLSQQQTANGDYEAQSAGQNGGYGSKSAASQQGANQEYKKTAKNIAALVKRY